MEMIFTGPSMDRHSPSLGMDEAQLSVYLHEAVATQDASRFHSVLDLDLFSATSDFELAKIAIDFFSDANLSRKPADLKILDRWVDVFCSDPSTRQINLASLLGYACGLYPQRSTAAINTLLNRGADPSVVVDNAVTSFGGMRHHMFKFGCTPLAIAIENGYRAITHAMTESLEKIHGKKWRERTVAHVAIAPPDVDVESVSWQPLDAMAFATAAGQTEITREILLRSDFYFPEVREHAGRSIESLVKLGLLHEGPDSVLADVIAMLAEGADVTPNTIRALNQIEVQVDDLSLRFPGLQPSSVRLPGLIALSAGHVEGLRGIDGAKALKVLLDVDSGRDVDMFSPSKGVTLAHCCALGGSLDTMRTAIAAGFTGTEVDSNGASVVDYAQSAGNVNLVKLVQNVQARRVIGEAVGPKSKKVTTDKRAESFRVLCELQHATARRAGARP